MERDPSQTLYTVALTGVRDKKSQMQVAQTLSSVSGRLPMEAVMQRLNVLPWTLTRKASYKRAYRLTKLLESLGAQVQCTPPLQRPGKPPMDETQILPSAELLSETQVMSVNQLAPRPERQPPASGAPVPAPKRQGKQIAAPQTRTPPVVENAQEKPVSQETKAEVQPSFFQKHLWELLVGLLAVAVMAGSVWLAVYVSCPFGPDSLRVWHRTHLTFFIPSC